ncbi:sigma-70 family RNA polymerase sigma factor [bacterium]|nr:sigma-70 family RNA polymerase sigma factor [bacterium]MBU1990635.1 sigma-70 family RNA polymerase sigma factor [bacterium]
MLINRYQNKIFNVCKSVLKDHHLSEDATQNSMLRIFHYLKKFKNESSFYTWAYKIAYNESLQIINKNKNMFVNDNVKDLVFTHDPVDMEIEVESIMQKLNQEEQELLFFKYTLEFADEEIASIAGISLSACKMRLKRLKEKIKNEYKD